MAVTKKTRTIVALAVLTPVLLLGFQNCMVDMAKTTPGASTAASSCSPSSSDLADFQTVESAILANTTSFTAASGTTKDGCASCHGQDSFNAGKAVFLISTTASGTLDTTTSTANFCTMKIKGKTRLMHPGDSSHSGGQYTTSDIPSYYTLINKYF